MKINASFEKWVYAQGSVILAAKKLGVSRQTIYHYLWGARNMSDKNKKKIKKLIG
jgi:predicted transcriptional regulator YheO